MKRRHKYIILLVVLIAVLFGAAALFQDVFRSLTGALVEYEEAHPFLGAFLFIALGAASVMLGPFTSAPIVPFAVAVWGTPVTLGLLLVGWLLGNSIAYVIGFYLGYPIVKKIVSEPKLKKWSGFISREVHIGALLLFRLAIPSEVGYVFGVLRYEFLKYLFIVFVAELPFALIVIYAGEAIIDSSWLTLTGLGAGTVAIIVGALWMLKRVSRRREAQEKEVQSRA